MYNSTLHLNSNNKLMPGRLPLNLAQLNDASSFERHFKFHRPPIGIIQLNLEKTHYYFNT